MGYLTNSFAASDLTCVAFDPVDEERSDHDEGGGERGVDEPHGHRDPVQPDQVGPWAHAFSVGQRPVPTTQATYGLQRVQHRLMELPTDQDHDQRNEHGS